MAILEIVSRKARGYEEALAPDSDLHRESSSFLFLGFSFPVLMSRCFSALQMPCRGDKTNWDPSYEES